MKHPKHIQEIIDNHGKGYAKMKQLLDELQEMMRKHDEEEYDSQVAFK